jgi:trehalose-6-phosphate synthase
MAADPSLVQEQQRLTQILDIRADIIGLGVDRLDYTKGIPERLAAIDARGDQEQAERSPHFMPTVHTQSISQY